jgi:uracil-DNA glycosylase
MVDIRKSLGELRGEWESCTACDLGVRRQDVEGPLIFGQGDRRGIMFIGDGPVEEDDAAEGPFSDKAGALLRNTIGKLGLPTTYFTYTVACRSCEHAVDGAGAPMYRKDRRGVALPMIRDRTPSPPQIAACRPRLLEEIYLVDPILIVTLGAEATSAVMGKSISITSERGKTRQLDIPGSWYLPSRTDKKQVWARKVKGVLTLPSEQNTVGYLVLPTLHPAYALRMWADKRPDNPLDLFLEDLRLAANVYDKYMQEALGIIPSERDVNKSDVLGDPNG